MEEPGNNGRVHGHVSYDAGPSNPRLSFHTEVVVNRSDQNYRVKGPINLSLDYVKRHYPNLFAKMSNQPDAIPISLPEKDANNLARRFLEFKLGRGVEEIALDTLIKKSSKENQDSQYALKD